MREEKTLSVLGHRAGLWVASLGILPRHPLNYVDLLHGQNVKHIQVLYFKIVLNKK